MPPCDDLLSDEVRIGLGTEEACAETVRFGNIMPAALANCLGRPGLTIVDVRGLNFFLGYIPGSRRLPFELFSTQVGKLVDELAQVREVPTSIVVVCQTGGAMSQTCAKELAQAISTRQMRDWCQIYILEGGFQAWDEAFRSEARDERKYIARVPYFPGAPHADLVVQASYSSGSRPNQLRRLPSCSDARTTSSAPSCGRRCAPAVGDTIWVRSRTLGETWQQAVVLATTSEMVKVYYAINGKCYSKSVPIDSQDLSVCPPEHNISQESDEAPDSRSSSR